MPSERALALVALMFLFSHGRAQNSPQPAGDALFAESFDDDRLVDRGWYDGDKFKISAAEVFAGKGSIEYHWAQKGTTPDSS